jgi:hypothetical protein
MVSSSSLSVDAVKDDLKRLRAGPALARPTALLTALAAPVRAYLGNGRVSEPGSADEVTQLMDVICRAVEGLAADERLSVEVDFNLAAEHRYPTLTERQESLARLQKCAAKTVRRRADRALCTLAYLLLTNVQPRVISQRTRSAADSAPTGSGRLPHDQTADRSDDLRTFWCLSDRSRVDIVCSEIPKSELPEYASPIDRNYLRYAKFADLDTLIYLRTRFAQLSPNVTVRDFAPSEYYEGYSDNLVEV